MSSECLMGIAVSGGIGIGPALRLVPWRCERPEGQIAAGDIQSELARYAAAEQAAAAELAAKAGAWSTRDPDRAGIFAAHLEMMRDPCVTEDISARIAEKLDCCEKAVWDAYEEVIGTFLAMEEPMFRSRAEDLVDVRGRLLRCCAGVPERDLSELDHPVVLLAHDLAPSDTACLPAEYILGIAAEVGAPTSHTAILARSSGIPAVLGVSQLLERAEDGVRVIVDALGGQVILSPAEETLRAYQEKQQLSREEARKDRACLSQGAVTLDGTSIATEINLGSVEEAHSPEAAAADGVGLLRTEFLYMQAQCLPDEETQLAAYREILQCFGDRPVILRTLDIGGDKQLPYLELPREDNPFLGLRALRFCLAHEELFRTQLRAAYRAAVYGNLWIMFPMVGSLEDFRRAKALCLEVQRELEEQGLPFRRDVKLGIMIEVPSIALMADAAARETDFASIGTNDLCQYVCAADRLNSAAAPYYRMTDPGLLRLIAGVAAAYAREGKSLGVCGEMASVPELARLLAGLGVRTLSMSGAALGAVRRALSDVLLPELEAQAKRQMEG